MNAQEHQFPQYRKYPDGKTFFKITAPDAFEEIRIIGQRYEHHTYKAEKLPDRNMVEDLLNAEGHVAVTSEADYEQFKRYCLEELSAMG